MNGSLKMVFDKIIGKKPCFVKKIPCRTDGRCTADGPRRAARRGNALQVFFLPVAGFPGIKNPY